MIELVQSLRPLFPIYDRNGLHQQADETPS